jgi:hypothetical protein
MQQGGSSKRASSQLATSKSRWFFANAKPESSSMDSMLSNQSPYLDAMMTKYSRYEHAQPGEAPVPLPEPDELAEDLKNLKSWLDEFAARVIPS